MSISLIIGAGGQDGRLLVDLLNEQNEKVWQVGNGWFQRPGGEKEVGSIKDEAQVRSLIQQSRPDRIFYLAAYHHASSQKESIEEEEIWGKSEEVHLHYFRRFLNAVIAEKLNPHIFYAASSLVFGAPTAGLQNEESELRPICVYGITKTMGVHLAKWYRAEKKLKISVGYLYTHESALRGENFVAKKIVRELKEISRKERKEMVLGDLSAQVDWGYAPDYVRAMELISRNPQGEDYIIATGESHGVGEFAEIVCDELGIAFKEVVKEDCSKLVRKKRNLVGDPQKLKNLGWRPSLNFKEMVRKLLHESNGQTV